MGFLTDLLESYNKAEDLKLVDKYTANDTVLLPVYHNIMNSNGNNIVLLTLTKESQIIQAEFMKKMDKNGDTKLFETYIVFPVTMNSGARTSGKCAHPIVDNFSYLSTLDEIKHEMYLSGLRDFYDYVKDDKVKIFLRSIIGAVEDKDFFNRVVDKIYGKNLISIDKTKVKYQYVEETKSGEKIKEATLDFKDVYVNFKVIADKGRDYTVTDFTDLHREFIDYIDSQRKNLGICNISGKEEEIVDKHRGILGNAKVISVSNNRETYFGRFKDGSEVIQVGYESSEKVHLMIKYLLENNNTRVWLGSGQYLINWFSDDIQNKSGLDPSNSAKQKDENVNSKENFLGYIEKDEIEEEIDDFTPNEGNKNVGESFIKGKKMFSDNSNYYAMILDKSSNGRISIKYYNKIKSSQLLLNLNAWGEKYKWYRKTEDKKSYEEYIPSLGQILLSSYGIERDGKLVLDNDNFKKDQFRKLVISVIEGRDIPDNLTRMLKLNIRNRIKYDKQWLTIMYIALAILSKERKEDFNMKELESQTVSYLYGRLLSVYERIESAVFDKLTKEKKDNSGGVRITNAEKFWNSFTNKPATMSEVLESKTKVYEMKLKAEKPGLSIIYNQEKQEIYEALANLGEKQELNAPLDYEFIFGYYGETKKLFTKKGDKDE